MFTLSWLQRYLGCNIFLSFSLSECVCATHVWVFLVSKACFVLFSIIHCGKLSVLYTLLAVSPASAPLPPTPPPAVPDFHLGIWGSRDADSTSISRSCHHSAGKSWLWLFLFSFRVKKTKNKKTTKSSYWCCKAWCSGALLSNLISYSLPPICAPFYCPLLLFLKHSRHCYICQYSPTSRTLTLWSVRIKQLKTELTSFP